MYGQPGDRGYQSHHRNNPDLAKMKHHHRMATPLSLKSCCTSLIFFAFVSLSACGGGGVTSTQPSQPLKPTNSFAYLVSKPDDSGITIRVHKSDGSHVDVAKDQFSSAVLSHDGKHIVFAVGAVFSVHQVGIMNADGSGSHLLTTKGGSMPQFSPDDSLIIYISPPSDQINVFTDIHVMRIDGSSDVAITAPYTPKAFCQAAFSADGKMIAATVQAGSFLGAVVMNADGSSYKEVKSGGSLYSVAFAPDGQSIIYAEIGPPHQYDVLWKTSLDGAVTDRLTDGDDEIPYLHDDRIYFLHATQITPSQMYSIKSDGTSLTQLTFDKDLVGGNTTTLGCR